jgi:RNA polymerase sigma factor FliA
MSLEHYLTCRVRYAVVDAIRANDWVGKARRRQAAELDAATAELTARHLGRPPTAAELADFLGMDVDALAELRSKVAGVAWGVLPLDVPVENEHGGTASLAEVIPEPAPGPEAEVLGAEERRQLASVLDRLPQQYRDALRWRFLVGWQAKEIAARWGLHESRISQVIPEALAAAKHLAFQRRLVLPCE